ncbi:HAD family hydrolase [Microbacterium sp. ARD32]|uniref:HAD family hydrolase n=1 Tax=Microbacterium sp. ARD32 TaxID=2962577 RepID=UPI0028824741|nr:HAD family hydrolase [Microbacterium sp. ARD32]MDT0157818.1 HAD family hydrolase [Microbacterium sp. ARD32]
MAYRGVLLDFYGTLVDEDDPVIAGIVGRIERRHPGSDAGGSWSRAFSDAVGAAHRDAFRTQRDIAVSSLAATLRELGSSLDPEELLQEQFAYWRAPAVRPDAVAFLTTLELPVCVISNIDREDLDAALEHTGLPLANVVASDDIRSYKPRAELFEEGLRMLALPASEVLHVGDSVSSDIGGANALGIDVAWVNTHSRDLPQTMSVVQECRELTELLPLLTR